MRIPKHSTDFYCAALMNQAPQVWNLVCRNSSLGILD